MDEYERDDISHYFNHGPVKDKAHKNVMIEFSLQKIEVSSYKDLLYKCEMDLSVRFLEIWCEDILVHKVPIKEQNFFWDNKQ